MENPNAIEVKAKWGGTEPNGVAWAKLEYYMEHNPQQKHWRQVPGVVAGTNRGDAMNRAEAIAEELSELDIQELAPAYRKLYDNRRMFPRIADVTLDDVG